MFTISQIKEAHSKVKSGADFPSYIQDLVKLGVTQYETYVFDGHAEYSGTANYEIKSEAKYPALSVADNSDSEKFKHYLKIHQQGQTDFMTFCNHAAECGVEKWVGNTVDMTCSYYDKNGTKLLTEKIPS